MQIKIEHCSKGSGSRGQAKLQGHELKVVIFHCKPQEQLAR